MKVLHLAFDKEYVAHIKLIVERKQFDYTLYEFRVESLNYESLLSYDLIVLDSQNGINNSEALVKYIVKEAPTPIPIIVVSDQIEFKTKTQLYNLGIMTVMSKTDFSSDRFLKYLDTILREKETISKLSRMRIAVIDDSRFSLEIIRAFFEKYGITRIDYYLDPAEFIKHEHCYDLYLVDLVMPQYNGEDLIYHIRHKCAESIILLITTYGEGKAIGHCLSIGADDYILKPLDFKLFMLRLNTCMSHYQITKNLQVNHDKLYKLSTKDTLTGLHNRTYFNDAFERKRLESQRTSAPFSLVIFDLDYFKQVNDEYGHLKGDYVLQESARTIKSSLRGSDVLCRWGGEEFCVLLPNTSIDDASQVAENLRQAMEAMHIEDVGTVTASFGVTAWEVGDSYESIFSRVDKSLYLAKLLGRNNVVTNDEVYIKKGDAPVNIEWGPFFKSGHSEIDAEHFELIKLSNKIIVDCFTKQNPEKTIGLFAELIDHVVKHFDHEEKVLFEFKYKDLEEHKKIHRDLINKTLVLQKQLTLGQLSPINVAKYLVQDVVVGHIVKSDFEFYDLFPRKS